MLNKHLIIFSLVAFVNSAFAETKVSANASAKSFGKLTACSMAKSSAEAKMDNLCEESGEQLKYVDHGLCDCSQNSRTKRFDCEVRSRGLCD